MWLMSPSFFPYRERETSRFRVDVSVAEQDDVTFYLTYEVSVLVLFIRMNGFAWVSFNVIWDE